MGERALAFCRLSDGWELYHSQWAGEVSVVSNLLERNCYERRIEILEHCDWTRRHFRGEPGLYDIDCLSIATVYVVSPAGVTAYDVRWFGLPQSWGPTDSTLGVLVRLDTEPVAERRTQFQRVKTILQNAVSRGCISTAAAIGVLLVSFQDREFYLTPSLQRLAERL